MAEKFPLLGKEGVEACNLFFWLYLVPSDIFGLKLEKYTVSF